MNIEYLVNHLIKLYYKVEASVKVSAYSIILRILSTT